MLPTLQLFLNIFIIFSISITIVQDFYPIFPTPVHPSSPTNNTNQKNQTTSETFIQGYIIYATPQLAPAIKQLLKKEEISIKVELYGYEGLEWVKMIFLDYGHILVIYYFVTTYRGTNQRGKKRKILLMGGLIIFLWFIIIPVFKPNRLVVERKGEKIYEKSFIDKELIKKLKKGEYSSIIDDSQL